jgi:filamentous hemagglutinin
MKIASVAGDFSVSVAKKLGLDKVLADLKRKFDSIGNATNSGTQIALNRQNGAAFENQVVDALSHVGGTKNGVPVTVTLPSGKQVTTIPDLWGRNTGGILEVKNVQNLSNSNQLRAQLQLAEETGTPFNLVVSPRTQNISGPLRDRIDEVTTKVGGGIYRYDPSTGNLSNF